jgi:UDP-3-O-[3-hydroxymyristoyl] glucosamine N-acyltransferase
MNELNPGKAAWLIIGASGHGRSLASVIRGRGDIVAAVSDGSFRYASQQELAGRRELAPFRSHTGSAPQFFSDDDSALAFARENALSITVGIGENAVRTRVAAAILKDPRHQSLARPLVAASATVDSTAELGRLSQICEQVHVGPLAKIGDAALINTAAVVEHEAAAGAGSHVAPGAVLLGAAAIGEQVFLGSGARVLPGVVVGDFAILGAGAVATRPLSGMATYVGVPAQRLVSMKGPAN